jgi:aldose 1-epimerase
MQEYSLMDAAKSAAGAAVNPPAAHSGPVNATGEQFEIESGGYRAAVTELGAGLRELSVDSRPLVYGFGPDEPPHSGSGQLMAPWPNRVAAGRYGFEGQDRQLDLSEPAHGNAIHGLVRWKAWRPVLHEADRVVLALRLFTHPGYPHTLDLTADYSVSAAGLAVEVTARNVGTGTAPYGFAAHPYLTPGVEPVEGGIDEWTLHVPTERRVLVDGRLIPTGVADVDGSEFDFRSPRALGRVGMDTAFGGLQRELDGIGRVRVTEPGGGAVTLWLGRGLEWIQVFTGDGLASPARRAAVAVEPMSCPPDAFNSGTDLARLEPGTEISHRWGIVGG